MYLQIAKECQTLLSNDSLPQHNETAVDIQTARETNLEMTTPLTLYRLQNRAKDEKSRAL